MNYHDDDYDDDDDDDDHDVKRLTLSLQHFLHERSIALVNIIIGKLSLQLQKLFQPCIYCFQFLFPRFSHSLQTQPTNHALLPLPSNTTNQSRAAQPMCRLLHLLSCNNAGHFNQESNSRCQRSYRCHSNHRCHNNNHNHNHSASALTAPRPPPHTHSVINFHSFFRHLERHFM